MTKQLSGPKRSAAQPIGAGPKVVPSKSKAVPIKPVSQSSPPPPLTRDELARIPAGASSTEALIKATGGKIELIGRIQETNAVILHSNDRRLVYVRPQALGQSRNSEYKTGHLKKKLDQNGRYGTRQLDHVASTGVEGKRMGMGWVLAAFVTPEVNMSHGVKVEKGPVPVREANKAFQGGINRDGKHHVTYMTQEMVDKLAGKVPEGRGHGTFRESPSAAAMKRIELALMQDSSAQRHLATLGKPKPTTIRQTKLTKSQTYTRSR